MDPLTHTCIGALAGKTMQKWNGYRWSMLVGAVAGEIPDVDVFWVKGAESGLLHHRQWTHSIFGGVLVALIVAVIFYYFQKKSEPKVRFHKLALTAYVGVLLHIFGDWVTSYGTQVFYPFWNARLSLSSVFIIDLAWTSVLLVFVLLTLFWKRESYRIALLGLIFAVIYPWVTWGIKQGVEVHVENKYGSQFEKIMVDTELTAPWNWKVIGQKNNEYKMALFRLLKPDEDLEWTSYEKVSDDNWKELEEFNPFFKTYHWFTVYPIKKMVNGEEYIGDLRFISLNALYRKVRGRDANGPPALGVKIERNGEHQIVRFDPLFGK